MVETQYMPEIAKAWHNRVNALELKLGTKGRQRELEAFLQGALAALTVVGAMTMDRASQIAFLVMVDRGEDILRVEGVLA